MKISDKVLRRDIDDIMACALEGGITYWCDNARVVEDRYYGEYASDQISRGGSLELHDYVEDENRIINLDNFLNGLELAIKKGYAKHWYSNGKIDMMNMDAVAADIIAQLAIFGDVIYG